MPGAAELTLRPPPDVLPSKAAFDPAGTRAVFKSKSRRLVVDVTVRS
jgi:hypothetical protein